MYRTKTHSEPIWNPGGGTASVVTDEGRNDNFVSNIGYMLSRVSKMYADNKQKNIPIVDRQLSFSTKCTVLSDKNQIFFYLDFFLFVWQLP